MDGTKTFFHDCSCIFTVRVPYAYVIFSTTYVQYAYFIPEVDLRSVLDGG